MGPVKKARDSVSSHIRRESEAKAASAQAKAAQAQAERAEVDTKITQEQATAIARALQQDETDPQAGALHEVAEEEAEAVPWNRPAEP
jgi:hypothetical protein